MAKTSEKPAASPSATTCTPKSALNSQSSFHLVNDVTRFSDLGTPPEKCRIMAPFYAVFLLVIGVVSTVTVLGLLPVILFFILLRTLLFCRVKYRKDPKDVRVAVIGGGWAGIQLTQRLLELGVTPACYERFDNVGGTWHDKLRYYGIQIHGAMWITTFGDKNGPVPYSKDRDENDGKVSGDEVLRYIHKFTDDQKVREHYTMNSTLVGIKMQSAAKEATLVLEDTTRPGQTREEGPFDLVIYASQAAYGDIPKSKGSEEFKGKQLHTTQFRQSDFDDIVQNNKKVVIIGGSKAACDMVLVLHRAGYDNMRWVYRKPYLFWKYENTFHDRSFMNCLRGFMNVIGMLLAIVSSNLAGWVFWSTGIACTFGKGHNDWTKFHFGILCPKQRIDLMSVPEKVHVLARQEKLSKDGVVLDNGTVLEADVIIWATGNLTGIERVKLQKDGQPYALNDETRLFNHFVVPRFPVLASATALWTTFGPLRAVNSGDMAVYHLCVRGERTEEQMERRTKWQLSKNSAIKNFVWMQDAMVLRHFLFLHLDLMFSGIVAFEDFLYHAVQMFVFSHQTALRMNILPKQPKVPATASESRVPLLASSA